MGRLRFCGMVFGERRAKNKKKQTDGSIELRIG